MALSLFSSGLIVVFLFMAVTPYLSGLINGCDSIFIWTNGCVSVSIWTKGCVSENLSLSPVFWYLLYCHLFVFFLHLSVYLSVSEACNVLISVLKCLVGWVRYISPPAVYFTESW